MGIIEQIEREREKIRVWNSHRTYRIVFLIRTRDKVKTIYQANVTIEFTKLQTEQTNETSRGTSREWRKIQSRETCSDDQYELKFLVHIVFM